MSESDTIFSPRYWAVVPAAGIGQRMNVAIPKQYLEIQGKTLMEHTLERLLQFTLLEKIVVVLAKNDQHASKLPVLNDPRVMTAEGGAERYLSVINGLEVLDSCAHGRDWVLVHDVARPCVRLADLEWLVECLRQHPVGGLLGTQVRDTMKRTGVDSAITETVERAGLWHAFTPQMFRKKMLSEALRCAIRQETPITDEASAMEMQGYRPLMVDGHSDNIKVTSGPDLALASLYIEQQAKLIENP
ncbi:2-C-methyl-D-erythritol 4-phosphate cytidylyltransferase [Candidatus Sororendozoicomonas aggregata]|uniref:2-C-methyl-D-erythritol 4-phosphate cytidylyltransferase n=1 Tax=Candidatus Sororendozoicomonas aggregata TaxID=3073239 RepID=UPI002ED3BB04